MGSILDKITEFIKEVLQGWVLANLEEMFTDVNTKVGGIAGEVSKTPSTWNAGVFNMIRTLSGTVVVPIAGMIITFVLCYELINMVIDRNNMHDFDTWLFFKYLFKASVAVMLVSRTSDIVMGIFDVGSHMVTGPLGLSAAPRPLALQQRLWRCSVQASQEPQACGLKENERQS